MEWVGWMLLLEVAVDHFGVFGSIDFFKITFRFSKEFLNSSAVHIVFL